MMERARLDWLCEGLEELTIQRLSAAGQRFSPMLGALRNLIATDCRPQRFSHATMLRVGAELDADFVILGKFSSDGNSLTVESRVLRVNPNTFAAGARDRFARFVDGVAPQGYLETSCGKRPAFPAQSCGIFKAAAAVETGRVRTLYARTLGRR
jgi:hypothetical protein